MGGVAGGDRDSAHMTRTPRPTTTKVKTSIKLRGLGLGWWMCGPPGLRITEKVFGQKDEEPAPEFWERGGRAGQEAHRRRGRGRVTLETETATVRGRLTAIESTVTYAV